MFIRRSSGTRKVAGAVVLTSSLLAGLLATNTPLSHSQIHTA